MSMKRWLIKQGMVLSKHSPTILVGVGIVGVIGSTVMACKSTSRAQEVLEETAKDLDLIETATEKNNERDEEVYSKEDRTKDTVQAYTRTALGMAKVYGPSVLLGAASIACILTGHRILHKRYTGVIAAYTAVDAAYKRYRKEVVRQYGKDVDRKIFKGAMTDHKTESFVDENGDQHEIVVEEPSDCGYGRLFDETNRNWDKGDLHNYSFLKVHQTVFNDKLQSRGYVFLNEVYEALGFQGTNYGQLVGWSLDSDGDGYIDFGFDREENEQQSNFVEGKERSIWLDFNVDGPILQYVGGVSAPSHVAYKDGKHVSY